MKAGLTSFALAVALLGTGQAQVPAPQPEFEVADIQLSKPGQQESVEFLPGGRLQARGLTLKDLIQAAWGVDDDMVTGGPAWLASDHYDIVAKAPASATEETLLAMMRPLLAERFRLVVHKEEKVVPVYALSVGKRTPKLTPSAAKGKSDCHMQVIEGIRTFVCKNMSMGEFVGRLRPAAKAYLDHPVVDLTGLPGEYDFTVAWTGRGHLMGTAAGDADPAGGLSVFDAVGKQLGLDLAPRKHPLPVVVIDHIERLPTEN